MLEYKHTILNIFNSCNGSDSIKKQHILSYMSHFKEYQSAFLVSLLVKMVNLNTSSPTVEQISCNAFLILALKALLRTVTWNVSLLFISSKLWNTRPHSRSSGRSKQLLELSGFITGAAVAIISNADNQDAAQKPKLLSVSHHGLYKLRISCNTKRSSRDENKHLTHSRRKVMATIADEQRECRNTIKSIILTISDSVLAVTDNFLVSGRTIKKKQPSHYGVTWRD